MINTRRLFDKMATVNSGPNGPNPPSPGGPLPPSPTPNPQPTPAPPSTPTPGGGTQQKPFNLRDHMPPLPGQGGFGLPPTTPVPRKPLAPTDANLEEYQWDPDTSVPTPPAPSPEPAEPTPAPGGTQELPPRHDDAAFDAEMRAMAEEELNQGGAGEQKPFAWNDPSNYPWWLLPALGAGAGGLYGAFRKKRDDEDTLSAILSGAAIGGGLGGVGELGREYGYGQGLFEPGKGMFGKTASAKATYYNPFNGQTYVMDRPDMDKSAMVGGNVADEQQPLADALLKVLKKKTDPLYQRHGVYR